MWSFVRRSMRAELKRTGVTRRATMRRLGCEPLERRAVLATLFVSPVGNDSNTGTIDAPWRTLQFAVDNINPGDTIQVRSGTYAGFRIGESGSVNAPKSIKAESGAVVVINAPSVANRHQSNIEVELFNSVVTDWVIEGFEVAKAPRYGIDIRNTERIVIQNNFVHDSVSTGIFTAFSNYPSIQNNHSAANGEHGIYHSNSGDNPTIRGNLLHHNYASGIHMNGDVTQRPGDGLISSALIENNVIYENGRGGGSAINLDGVMDSTIRNNLATNNHASGISLYAIDGAAGSSRNRVYNNTFVMANDSRWVVNIPSSPRGKANPTGNQIQNNILFTPRSDRGSVLTYGTAVAGFVSDNNVVVNRFSVTSGKKIISLAQWQGLGYDKRSLMATPSELFIDPANNNYHLKSGSRAIDAGTAMPQLATDLDGVARPQGAGYDIGCYEYATSSQVLSSNSTAALTKSSTRLSGSNAVNLISSPKVTTVATRRVMSTSQNRASADLLSAALEPLLIGV